MLSQRSLQEVEQHDCLGEKKGAVKENETGGHKERQAVSRGGREEGKTDRELLERENEVC
jgi:hypothetical protein